MSDPVAVEDEDTLRAFQSYFGADVDLVAAIPGGLIAGDVPADQARPYAQIKCQQGPKSNEYHAPVESGSGYSDYRKVEIAVYGTRASVVAALGHLRRVFEWQPKGKKPMSVPNARLIQILSLPGSGDAEEDAERKEANPIWKATVLYQVWTGRLVP